MTAAVTAAATATTPATPPPPPRPTQTMGVALATTPARTNRRRLSCPHKVQEAPLWCVHRCLRMSFDGPQTS